MGLVCGGVVVEEVSSEEEEEASSSGGGDGIRDQDNKYQLVDHDNDCYVNEDHKLVCGGVVVEEVSSEGEEEASSSGGGDGIRDQDVIYQLIDHDNDCYVNEDHKLVCGGVVVEEEESSSSSGGSKDTKDELEE